MTDHDLGTVAALAVGAVGFKSRQMNTPYRVVADGYAAVSGLMRHAERGDHGRREVSEGGQEADRPWDWTIDGAPLEIGRHDRSLRTQSLGPEPPRQAQPLRRMDTGALGSFGFRASQTRWIRLGRIAIADISRLAAPGATEGCKAGLVTPHPQHVTMLAPMRFERPAQRTRHIVDAEPTFGKLIDGIEA